MKVVESGTGFGSMAIFAQSTLFCALSKRFRVFQVNDLEVHLVDAAGNLATIPRRGVKYFVSQKSASSTGAGTGGSSSRGKGSSSGRPKDLSKRLACLPSVEMPGFVLTMKLQEFQDEEAAERVSNSVALVVRAEGSELESVEEARFEFVFFWGGAGWK